MEKGFINGFNPGSFEEFEELKEEVRKWHYFKIPLGNW